MDDAQVTRFTVLWTQARSSVFAFISASVTHFADAEDLLQKVATTLVGKFDEYDQTRPFVAWAIGFARFEILRHMRDRDCDRHQLVGDTMADIAKAFEDVASELEDRRAALAECLKQVTGRSRQILEKRYGSGLKTGQIAIQMELKPGNVSVILNRTYRQLRECIDRKLAAGGVK